MLVPYTPVTDLTEEEKRAAAAQLQSGSSTIVVNGKAVNVNELKTQVKPPVRQSLFE